VAVIGDYGSVSQIRNVRVVNANKHVYDVLGTFPKRHVTELGSGHLDTCLLPVFTENGGPKDRPG
jgi:hypothetical protein